MTGVLLINMGSPLSKKEMRQFLFNMFTDRAILPFSIIPRTLLAFLISTFRYRNSWQKYQLIGGSKLKESMKLIEGQLAVELGSDYEVTSAYSYSKPTIQQGIETLCQKGITDIKIITMYPHSSISTTVSVTTDLEKVRKKYPDIKLTELGTYGENEHFVNYWLENIQNAIEKNGYKDPTLMFSAHSIPQYLVEMGDTYVDEVYASAKLISSRLNLRYRVAFQSKIGRMKWVGPDTKDCLKVMRCEKIDEVMLVPISFVNENLETAYDQGIEIIPYAKNELGIKNICRVEIPATHPELIAIYKQLLINA